MDVFAALADLTRRRVVELSGRHGTMNAGRLVDSEAFAQERRYRSKRA